MNKYKINSREITAELFLFTEKNIREIVASVPFNEEIGYAGYENKDGLKEILSNFSVEENNSGFLDENKDRIKGVVNKSVDKCSSFLKGVINIFIFPSSDGFVKEKMGGVGGFTPWKNTVLIFINPTENWQEYLEDTIIHELVHIITGYYGANNYSLEESFIHEGIAENFREHLSGRKMPWTRAINKEDSIKLFKEIKPLLKKRDYENYSKLFFGSDKYPLWAGYSIGYYLVKDYLTAEKNISWNEIISTSPDKILNKITKEWNKEKDFESLLKKCVDHLKCD